MKQNTFNQRNLSKNSSTSSVAKKTELTNPLQNSQALNKSVNISTHGKHYRNLNGLKKDDKLKNNNKNFMHNNNILGGVNQLVSINNNPFLPKKTQFANEVNYCVTNSNGNYYRSINKKSKTLVHNTNCISQSKLPSTFNYDFSSNVNFTCKNNTLTLRKKKTFSPFGGNKKEEKNNNNSSKNKKSSSKGEERKNDKSDKKREKSEPKNIRTERDGTGTIKISSKKVNFFDKKKLSIVDIFATNPMKSNNDKNNTINYNSKSSSKHKKPILKKTEEEIFKKINDKEKAFYILIKSHFLPLNQELLMIKLYPGISKVITKDEILKRHQKFLNDKCIEREVKINQYNKNLSKKFVPSQTAKIIFNFITKEDEEQFKNISNLDDKNNALLCDYYRILNVIANRSYENTDDFKTLREHFYKFLSLCGYKSCTEYLFNLLCNNKLIISIEKMKKVVSNLDKNFQRNAELFSMLRFLSYTSYLIFEIVEHVKFIMYSENQIELLKKV